MRPTLPTRIAARAARKFAAGRLRVINGLYPAGEPAEGQPLKIVE